MAAGATLLAALVAAAAAGRLGDDMPGASMTLLPFAIAIAAAAVWTGPRVTLAVTVACCSASAMFFAIQRHPGSLAPRGMEWPTLSEWTRVLLLAGLGALATAGASRIAHATRDAADAARAAVRAARRAAGDSGRRPVEHARAHAAFRVDADGRVASWNEDAERLFGGASADRIDAPLADVLAPVAPDESSDPRAAAAGRGRVADDLRRARSRAVGVREERRLRDRDGRPFRARVAIVPLAEDQDDDAAGFLVAVRGLGDDAPAGGSDAPDGRPVDELPPAVLYIGRDERYRYHNAGFARWLGSGGSRSCVGRSVREVLGERAHAKLKPHIDAALAGERTRYEQRLEIAGLPGPRDVAATYTPDRDAAGNVVGLSVFGEDVTRRRELEARSRDILESIADGFFSLDADWRFVYVNPRAAEHLGRAASALIGVGLLEAFPALRDAPSYRALARAMNQREPTSTEARSILNGRWFEVRAYPSGEDGLAVYFHDVTERRQAQELNARLATMVRYSTDAIITYTPEGVITAWNAAAERMFGYPAEMAVGRQTTVIVPADRGDEPGRLMAAARAGRPLRDFETRRLRADGAPVDVAVTVAAIRDEAGEIVGYSATVRDLTDRIARERNLRFLIELNAQVAAAESSPERVAEDAMRLLRAHLRADRCNYSEVAADRGTFDVLGTDADEAVGPMRGTYRFDDFEPRVLDRMRADEPDVVVDVDAASGRGVRIDAFRAVRVRAHVTVPLHADGRLVALVSVHQRSPRPWTREEVELVRIVADRCWAAMERARAARELGAREHQFRWLAETTPVLIWLGDAQGAGRRTWFSKPWQDFTGRDIAADRDRGWLDAVHPDDRDRVRRAIGEAVVRNAPFELDYRLRRHDGAYRWMLDRGVPIATSPLSDAAPSESVAAAEYMGSVLDITARKEGEVSQRRALDAEREARAESDRVGRLKDEFLATLGHELRTPLNAIVGWAQILSRGTRDPEDLKKGLETIARNAKAQAQIINDLLDMSRIISGKVRLELGVTPLADVLAAAVDVVRPAAQAKRVTLELTTGPDVLVRADPTRLQQVFWNLLTNAVKFTPAEGRVRVSLTVEGDAVRADVADSGAGIDAAFAPHVFERFRQADGSTTRQHGGLGLGLSIVKSLVELHGGRVACHSDGPNLGARFSVTLPVYRGEFARVAGAPAATDGDGLLDVAAGPGGEDPASSGEGSAFVSSGSTRLAGRRVLLVDDEPDVLDILGRVFREQGATVVTAGDAAAALDAVGNGVAAPDLIVSDIGMPSIDGYELIRRIRERKVRAPAIALTAFARAEDRERALAAGYQRHVAKPVEPDRIIAACDELLRETAAAVV